MRAVVLATDPDDGNARAWCGQLRAHGVGAQLLTHEPRMLPHADLVVAHLLLAAGRVPHPAWATARRYERAGAPLLNSTTSLALCADKWRTHRAWARAGLSQPEANPPFSMPGHLPGLLGAIVREAIDQGGRPTRVVRDRPDPAAAAPCHDAHSSPKRGATTW